MGKTRQSADLVSVNNIFVDIANDNVGIGTTLPRFKLEVGAVGASGTTLYVNGDARVTGILTVGTSSIILDGTGNVVNVGTAVTIHHIDGFQIGSSRLHSTGLEANSITGSGENITSLNASNLSSGIVPAARITSTSALSVGGDLYVTGNISFGGTSTQLNTQQLEIIDADIVLGIGTSFSPTDNTANHGGIAIASTEGTPLVDLNIDPAETNPSTYKKIMWFKSNTSGLGTDAWLTNYALGVGITQFSSGVRLAAGGMRVTDTTVSSPQLNISGVSTFVQTVEFDAGLKDFYGNVGAAGSVLVSTGAGVSWTRPTTTNLFGGTLRNYAETLYSYGNTGATPSFALINGNFVTATLSANITSMTFDLTGCPTTTAAFSFTLVLYNDGTAGRTITWPASVKWPNGTTPVRTTTANRGDVYTFFTYDGGTNWFGNLSLYNYA